MKIVHENIKYKVLLQYYFHILVYYYMSYPFDNIMQLKKKKVLFFNFGKGFEKSKQL